MIVKHEKMLVATNLEWDSNETSNKKITQNSLISNLESRSTIHM